MDIHSVSLYAGAGLAMLVGLACLFGAFVLRGGRASNWPDVVGTPKILQRTAIGLAIVGLLVIGSSTAVFVQPRGSFPFITGAMSLFVTGGFWGNHAVFGDFHPKHTVTNILVSAIALIFIWFGLPPDFVICY